MNAFLEPWLLYPTVLVVGLLVGSFLNVVILRLPPRLEYRWRADARELLGHDPEITEPIPPSIVWERSHCPKCGFHLKPWHNIPLFSYVFLRGKCAGCGAPISVQYPLIEAFTGLLTVLCIWRFGPTAQGLSAVIITWFLIAMSGIDFRTQLLPDDLTLPLLWGGLLASCAGVFVDPVSAILGAAFGYLALWSVFWGFKLLTGKDGMGYGDFKLLAALGAWLGWQKLPLIVLLSAGVGAVLGSLLIALKRHEQQAPMPFGPFLAAAGWIGLIWGDQLLARYWQFMRV